MKRVKEIKVLHGRYAEYKVATTGGDVKNPYLKEGFRILGYPDMEVGMWDTTAPARTVTLPELEVQLCGETPETAFFLFARYLEDGIHRVIVEGKYPEERYVKIEGKRAEWYEPYVVATVPRNISENHIAWSISESRHFTLKGAEAGAKWVWRRLCEEADKSDGVIPVKVIIHDGENVLTFCHAYHGEKNKEL